MTARRTTGFPRLAAYVLAGALLALPAGARQARSTFESKLSHLSQAVAIRHWLARPESAPEPYRARFLRARELLNHAAAPASPRGSAPARPPRPPLGDRFNIDDLGMPQNEESVTLCSDPTVVFGGTNDYRGLVDPDGNFTGWHLSLDGGASVANEGLLPEVDFGGGILIPSGGDPVQAAGSDCALYAASLAFDPDAFFPNGIAVYRSTPDTLLTCPGGADPSCWPTREVVAAAPDPTHFFDKEWFDVGMSGDAGEVVWVAFSDFMVTGPGPTDFTASIKAVRCSPDLASCTAPMLVSGDDPDVQFSDVTIGPDGRVYVTWSEIEGEIEGMAQTFVHKLRVAPAGSTAFGPERVIAEEPLALPFGGFLHANDFRIATVLKHDVKVVGGVQRVFAVWDRCRARPLDTICEEPEILLTWSDDEGATWTDPMILSVRGDNYFPTVAGAGGPRVAVAWFTNRFDRRFHNAQDVELVTVNAVTGEVEKRQRLTEVSNETEADPLLGGTFIGDYFEVTARGRTAYVHYNANYRRAMLLPGILPPSFSVPQQDNYMAKADLR